jgi:hypothetical protein
MHWRAKLGAPVEISVQMNAADGLGWFWLSRQTGSSEEEISRVDVPDADGSAAYQISASEIEEWGGKRAYLILSTQPAMGTQVPLMLDVRQNEQTLEARDNYLEPINAGRSGSFKPVELGKLDAGKTQVFLFDLWFSP